jgi:sugar lactone lactonase YvrE
VVVQEEIEWECLVPMQSLIGEVPFWSTRENALYWIDVRAPALYRRDGKGAIKCWPMPSLIGSYAIFEDRPRALVALHTGLYELDLACDQLVKLCDAPYASEHYRFNDGKCDRHGRFWVGSSRLPNAPVANGSAAFYRFDGRALTQEIPGITVANGIAWSPAGDLLYMVDAPNKRILRFPYDLENGKAGPGETFARTPGPGNGDGATVDAEGGYWIAMIRDGRILRFLPDGTLDRDIRTPTALPTMVAFGGPDLDELYLTTSSYHYPSLEAKRGEPLAGSIFRCRPGISGIADNGFAPA